MKTELTELSELMRYQKGKMKNGYTEIIDTWNHNCVEVKVRYTGNVKIIMEALEVAHIKEQGTIVEARRGDMFYNARYGI